MCVQDLAALGDAYAVLGADVGVPDHPIGIEADAVGVVVAKRRPHSSVRQRGVGVDVKRREVAPVGLGDVSVESSGVTAMPLGNMTPSATQRISPAPSS